MVGSGEPVAEQLIAKGVVHSVTSILLLWSWRTEGRTVCVLMYVCDALYLQVPIHKVMLFP